MHDIDRQAFYEQIRAFATQFPYVYEDGITVETKDYFFRLQTEGKREVKDFALFFDPQTNQYRVTVLLHDLATAHSVFQAFVRFIAYAGATLTASKKTARGIQSFLASFDEQGRGFYCDVDFLLGETTAKAEKEQIVHEAIANSQRSPDVTWTFRMDSARYLPLVVAEGLVYGVGDEGDVYALDAKQGSVRWYWKTDMPHGKIASLPGVDRGLLAIYTYAHAHRMTYEAMLSVLDAQTGDVLSHTPVPALGSSGFCHLLAVQDGIAYLSGTDRNLPLPDQRSLCLAIDLRTGSRLWAVAFAGYFGTTTPVVTSGRVYLATFAQQQDGPLVGSLYALDAQTGTEIWHSLFERRGVQEIVVDGTDIFVNGTAIEVIDALSGMTRWQIPIQNMFQTGPLAVNDERICISYERMLPQEDGLEARNTEDILLAGGSLRVGEIMAVNRASRQKQWVVPLTYGRSVPDGVIIVDKVLYTTWKHLDIRGVVTHTTLFALDVQTGQEYWRFEAEDLSAPVIVNGTVFIRGWGDQQDAMYALFDGKG